MEEFDQHLAVFGQADNATVRSETQMGPQAFTGGVQDPHVLFGRVTPKTGVNEIGVGANKGFVFGLGDDVIDGKVSVPVSGPHLPLETVRAAKLKFVP
jgi:hypothetical protein